MASQRGGIPGLEGISEMFDDIFEDEEDEETLEQSLLPFGVGGDAKEVHSSLPFGIGSRPTSGPTEIVIPHDPIVDGDAESESHQEKEPEIELVADHESINESESDGESAIITEEQTDSVDEEFSRFDTDASGTISVEEIALATGLEEEQARELHSEIDTDDDGEISAEEFKEAVNTQSLAERLGIPMIKARPVINVTESEPVTENVTTNPPNEVVEEDDSPEAVLLGDLDSQVFSPPQMAGDELLALYEDDDNVIDYRHDEEFVSEVVVEHETTSSQATNKNNTLDLHPAKAMVVQATIETRELIRTGFTQMSSSDWVSACATFQRLAQQLPNDPAVQNNLGLCFLQIALSGQDSNSQQLFENSIITLRNAAKANPSEMTILVNLAQALLLSERTDKALRVIESVLQRDSGHCEAANLHAVILYNLGRIPEAKRSLGIITESDNVIIANLRRLQAV